MSVIELLNGAVEVPWVVLSEPKMLLTFFEAADTETNNQNLTEHLNKPEMHRDRFHC